MVRISFMLSTKKACFVIVVLLRCTNSELYTAIAGLESLLDTEEVYIKNLQKLIETEEKKLEYLREAGAYFAQRLSSAIQRGDCTSVLGTMPYGHELDGVIVPILNIYEKEHGKAVEDRPNYIRNPFNAFTLIKRLTADRHAIGIIIRKEPEIKNPPNITYPTKEDLDGAADALGRLQTTYNLDITDLANGVLNARINKKLYTEHFTPMTASDCYQVGRRLYDLEDYKNAANWVLVALQKYKAGHTGPIHNAEESFLKILSFAYTRLGDLKNALKWTEKWSALAPNDYNTDMIKKYKKLIASNNFKVPDPPTSKLLTNYGTLCRGELDLPNKIKKSLKCRYLTENNIFLKLAPFKMEQLHSNPEVLLLHEVINDEEIQHIKKISVSKLTRAEVVNANDSLTAVPYRITKIAWFSAKDSEVLARLSQRMADFSGLSMDLSEDMQVGNYGIGGHYELHTDFFGKGDAKYMTNGNRIATILLYMSDVKQGGATVFTKFGLTVFPVKGAALFWMNLLPSGEGNQQTRHAACPVLRGEKWIINRWINQAGQELSKPCPHES